MTDEDQNFSLSPEQIELAIKLEGIFMPEARKQRDEVYKEQIESGATGESVNFVHYTSAEAALSIINSKRVWMRNTTCMSDYREVQHGFEIFRKFFSDKPKTDAFIAAIDRCAPGAVIEAITQFDQYWNNIQYGTYITSISKHDNKENFHGRLSMWRAFGGNTARVAIVLNIPRYSNGAQALGLMFSPVSYLTEEEVHAVVDKVIINVNTNCDFLSSIDHPIIVRHVFNMLLAGVVCLKHEGFREEREWRAIYSPGLFPSALMEFSTEIIGGVPQIVYKLPLDKTHAASLADLDFSHIFDRLIIGPSPYPVVMNQAFTEALAKAGVPQGEKQRVFISDIPIRS